MKNTRVVLILCIVMTVCELMGSAKSSPVKFNQAYNNSPEWENRKVWGKQNWKNGQKPKVKQHSREEKDDFSLTDAAHHVSKRVAKKLFADDDAPLK